MQIARSALVVVPRAWVQIVAADGAVGPVDGYAMRRSRMTWTSDAPIGPLAWSAPSRLIGRRPKFDRRLTQCGGQQIERPPTSNLSVVEVEVLDEGNA